MKEHLRQTRSVRRPRRSRFRFWLERLVIRGLKFRLLLASIIVVGVALIAGVLVFTLADGFSNPVDAVWWAFLRLTDPGYLGDDEGVAMRSISTVVTVLGYILFLGLLIAILTQWLNQTIAKLESGVTPVVLSNHVVVLGWTHQTRSIVESLLHAGARMERFLARRGARDLHVVIMVEEVDEALRQRLLERFGRDAGRRVMLRAGTPLRVDHLERVAYRDAAVIILPGAGFAERNPEQVDSLTVKTLASVSRFAGQTGEPPPFVVAELFDVRNVSLAKQAYKGQSEIFAADGMISRLIAQSLWHRGLWTVMSELFMLRDGNDLHVRQVEGQAGATFRDCGERCSRAILLGLIRPGEPRPLLNPDQDTLIEPDDMLVFLARRFKDCEPGPVGTVRQSMVATERPLRETGDGRRRVLILGWSRRVPALLRELGRLSADAFEIEIVSGTPVAEREADLARYLGSTMTLSVKQIEAGFATPGVIEELEPERYHNVVVLASELLEETEHADAVTVAAALRLRACFADRGSGPEVMVELLDDENLSLFCGGNEDVIVSPMVVSYIVSQVALRRELASVFWELTRPWGAQIVLRSADAYVGAGGSVRFDELQQHAAARGDIALGFRQRSNPENGLVLNPDRDIEWSIESGDEVVVLTSIEEPSS